MFAEYSYQCLRIYHIPNGILNQLTMLAEYTGLIFITDPSYLDRRSSG